MRFYISQDFSKQVSTLTEKAKDGYITVISDICNELKRYTNIDQAWAAKVNALTLSPDVRLIKTEVKNSGQSLPKNNGFRLYFIVDRTHDHVCLTYVYPKRGKHQVLSISDEFEIILAENYIIELGSDTLQEVDIANKLKAIPKTKAEEAVPANEPNVTSEMPDLEEIQLEEIVSEETSMSGIESEGVERDGSEQNDDEN